MQYLPPPAPPYKNERCNFTKQAAGDKVSGGLIKSLTEFAAPQRRESIEIRFCGGVYVAKNTLRGASVAGWHRQPRRRAKRNSLISLSNRLYPFDKLMKSLWYASPSSVFHRHTPSSSVIYPW